MEEAVDDDDYALLFGTEQPAGKVEKVEKATEKAEKKKPKALPAAVGAGEACEA